MYDTKYLRFVAETNALDYLERTCEWIEGVEVATSLVTWIAAQIRFEIRPPSLVRGRTPVDSLTQHCNVTASVWFETKAELQEKRETKWTQASTHNLHILNMD
jgi:hypothetical protein